MKLKVLIVDDSENWVKFHAFAITELFDCNVQIQKANSAQEGLSKLMNNIDEPYDVILTDMQMEPDYLPLLAGEWFIQQIKTFKEYNKTKIFIISATSSIKDIARKYKVDYIPKYMCRNDDGYNKIKESL
jgi:CheY-like chemotaxis protein